MNDSIEDFLNGNVYAEYYESEDKIENIILKIEEERLELVESTSDEENLEDPWFSSSEMENEDSLEDKGSTEKDAFTADEPNSQSKIPKLDYVVTALQMLKTENTEFSYLLKPLLPKTGLVALAGSSDTGKSSFLRQLAINIVLNRKDFLGFELNCEHNRVLYISTEDDENAISVLIKKQNSSGINSPEFERLGYIFDTSNLKKKLNEVLSKHKVDCIIIDTFTDLYNGDLNSANKVRNYLQDFKKLADKYQFLCIFIHHTSKAAENKSANKNNLLGTQGFESKMRLVIELKKDTNDNNIRYLCIVKGNYLGENYKNMSYKLTFNENLCFSNTNIRVSFSSINNSNTCSQETRKNMITEVKYLHDCKMSVRKIVEFYKKKGITISKSTISNYLNHKTENESVVWVDKNSEDSSSKEEDESDSEVMF